MQSHFGHSQLLQLMVLKQSHFGQLQLLQSKQEFLQHSNCGKWQLVQHEGQQAEQLLLALPSGALEGGASQQQMIEMFPPEDA